MCECVCACMLYKHVCALHRVGVWLHLYTEVNASLRAKYLLKLCTLNDCWYAPVVHKILQFQISSIYVPQFTGFFMCVQSDCNCNRHFTGMQMYLTMLVEIKLCSRNMPHGMCLVCFHVPFLFVDIEFCYLVKCVIFFFFFFFTWPYSISMYCD